jgi:tetratricopeptide (TPR) repeat protein
MPLAPVVIVLPIFGLLVTRSGRSVLTLAAVVLLTWLNLWWILAVAGIPALDRVLPAFLLVPRSTVVMVLGHLFVFTILLVAFGMFSPRHGSPADLAVRAARRGDFLAAGEFWLEAGHQRRALRAFLRGHAWGRAGELSRSMGRLRRAARLLIREGGDSLATAAQLFARAGEAAMARQTWLRYGSVLVESHRPEQAIEPFLRAGDLRRATHAAELALEGQRLSPAFADAAIRAAREAKRPQLGARVAVASGRFHEAGDLYLAADEPLEAARAFERAGETMRAAEALRLAGQVEEAARIRGQKLFDTGKVQQALVEYESAGMEAESARALEKLGRFEEATERYRRAGLVAEAADLANRHLDPRQAATLYAELEAWPEAGTAWERAGEPLEASRAFERVGDYVRAEEVLDRAGLVGELAQVLARAGRVEDGFNALYRHGDRHGAWELLSSYGGTFPGLAEPLVELAGWLQSRGDLPGAISAVQRSISGIAPRRELLPAFYALANLLEQQGDVRAAESVWQQIAACDYAFRDVAQRLQATASRRAAAPSAPPVGAAAGSPAASDAASRYVLEQELGRGGMGVVYRARDTRLGRTVAIKILNPRQHTPDAIRRFEREARAAAVLSHPGIVHIYDFDRGFSSFFISMEYVSGPTLNHLVREEAAFVRRNLVGLMRQIVDAVGYAHHHHVVHRDLKPANMIIAERRQLKILDFGIARRLDELDLSASGATGTPYYMAPEQILGENPDSRTDVYALGVTFYQLATGALPFATGNILRAHLEQPPPDPGALAPDLDPTIAHLIVRCLAKNPDQRPRDGAALAIVIERLGSGTLE